MLRSRRLKNVETKPKYRSHRKKSLKSNKSFNIRWRLSKAFSLKFQISFVVEIISSFENIISFILFHSKCFYKTTVCLSRCEQLPSCFLTSLVRKTCALFVLLFTAVTWTLVKFFLLCWGVWFNSQSIWAKKVFAVEVVRSKVEQ